MDEKPNEIMQRIESQRDRLGQNIQELERRVKETTDVKAQFERHPMVAVGLAFGGGLLLSSLVAGSGSRRSRPDSDSSSTSRNRGYWSGEGSRSDYSRDDYSSGWRSRDFSDSSSSSSYSSPSYSPSSRYASSSYSGPGSSYSGAGSGSGYSGYSGARSSYAGAGSRYSDSYSSPSAEQSSYSEAEPRRSFAGAALAGAGSSAAMSAISHWLQNSKLGEQKDQALRTLDNMGAAFLSMAAEKVKDFLDGALPGFKQHLDQQERGQQHGFSGQAGYKSSSQGGSDADSSGGSQRTSNSAAGSGRSNWSTDPAQQGSYTNQGAQTSGWQGGNPAQQGSRTQMGEQEQRSRNAGEQTGTVQPDASSSSYKKS